MLIQVIVKFNTICSKLSYRSSKIQYLTTKNSHFYSFYPKLKRSLAKIQNLGFSVQLNFNLNLIHSFILSINYNYTLKQLYFLVTCHSNYVINISPEVFFHSFFPLKTGPYHFSLKIHNDKCQPELILINNKIIFHLKQI